MVGGMKGRPKGLLRPSAVEGPFAFALDQGEGRGTAVGAREVFRPL